MQNHTLEKLSYYSFLALIVWLPIPLGSNRVWAWSILEMWIAVQSITLIVAYRGNLPLEYLARYKYLVFTLVAFQLWVFIQTLPFPIDFLRVISPNSAEIYQSITSSKGSISLDPSMTLISLYKGMAYTLVVINAIFIINSSQRLRSMATCLVVGATFQAFYASFMVLLNITESLIFKLPEQNIATGSFVYKNHLANYLMMALCIGLGLIVTQLHVNKSGSWRTHLRRILESILSNKMFIRLCLVIMVIGLVMTRSRMGNTAFFAAVTIGGVLALLLYKHKPRALPLLVASIVAIDTIVVGALFGLAKVKQRIAETSLIGETRDQVVVWCLDIIRDFPFTGTGMASFYSVFPMYSKADIGFYDHAHNDYVQFAVEAGIPATLLLGTVIIYSFCRAIRTIQRRNSRTMKGIALGSIMAMIGMMIHISVDFNLQPTANALTFLLILFFANATSVLPATGILKLPQRVGTARQPIKAQ